MGIGTILGLMIISIIGMLLIKANKLINDKLINDNEEYTKLWIHLNDTRDGGWNDSIARDGGVDVASKACLILGYIEFLENESKSYHDFDSVDEIGYNEFNRTVNIKGYTKNDVLLKKEYRANAKLVKNIESNNNSNKFGGLN